MIVWKSIKCPDCDCLAAIADGIGVVRGGSTWWASDLPDLVQMWCRACRGTGVVETPVVKHESKPFSPEDVDLLDF